jgi:hypothetical protein
MLKDRHVPIFLDEMLQMKSNSELCDESIRPENRAWISRYRGDCLRSEAEARDKKENNELKMRLRGSNSNMNIRFLLEKSTLDQAVGGNV